jgi:hypothetical protein
MEQRGGILQATGFIDQLFDVHRNRHPLSNAPRQRAGFRGAGDARGIIEFAANLGQHDDGRFDLARSMKPPATPTHAPKAREVERIPSNLMALFACAGASCDGEGIKRLAWLPNRRMPSPNLRKTAAIVDQWARYL